MEVKPTYWRWISWCITILAYIYLAYKLYMFDRWSELGTSLLQADAIAWLCGAIALLLMPLNMLLEAWRWQYLMEGLSIREAQRQVYFSKMAGQLTPYQLGEYPARGLLMSDCHWAEILSKGVVGSMTMTLAIAAVGVGPMIIWFVGAEQKSRQLGIVVLMILAVVVVTFLLPMLLRRWVTLRYRTLFGSLGQSLLRYLCWCVQLALVLRLFGLPFTLEWFIQIPVYYLLITVAPSVSVAEAGVRGAAAMFLFSSVEATLAGVLLWMINSLLPMLIGSFMDKNTKIFGELKKKE